MYTIIYNKYYYIYMFGKIGNTLKNTYKSVKSSVKSTVQNVTRKSDKEGNVHMISFLSAILSRLAYFNDNKFLVQYSAIIGPVIQPVILKGINSVSQDKLSELLDDEKIYGLNGSSQDIFKDYHNIFQGNTHIDFIALNMPQNVNIINNEVKGTPNYLVPGEPTKPDDVKYISLGWSNYGEIFIVADKRMPNTIFLIFRGTYSSKTAAIYSKPSSVVPLTAYKTMDGEPEKFLYGIYKVGIEMIHTIIESMVYLARDFLGATKPNSVKVFTTGHSLGGAMCTNFAYSWMTIKKVSPYNTSPYNILADNIVCVSLGSPRCMSSTVAKKFCNFVEKGKILYLRITTTGDPIPGVPLKTGYQHPCSENEEMRKVISEACNTQLTMRPVPNVNYAGNLDCQNYKTRPHLPNPLSHTVYLDILFVSAVDIVNFLKGMVKAVEVTRTPTKSTVCRIIMGSSANYKAIFFDVNLARLKPTNQDAIEEAELNKPPTENPLNELQEEYQQQVALEEQKGVNTSSNNPVALAAGGGSWGFNPFKSSSSSSKPEEKSQEKYIPQDVRIDGITFNNLIGEMEQITGNLCPMSGKMFTNFGNKIMPQLPVPEKPINEKLNIETIPQTQRQIVQGGKFRKTKKIMKNKRFKNTRKNKNFKKNKRSRRH